MSLLPAQAQNFKESYQKYFKRPIPYQVDSVNKAVKNNVVKTMPPTKSTSNMNDLNRIEIGKSADVYSILHSEQRTVYYSDRTNSMHYIFNPDPDTYPDVTGANSLALSYSEGDYWSEVFEFWEEPMIINPDQGGIKDPSVVLINPDNSQEIDDLYAVISAPHSLDETNWTQTLFASTQLNEDHYQENYYTWESENDIARSSMTVVDDEVYIFGQDYENMGDYARYQTLKHYKGISDDPANGFNWENNSVSPDWLIDPDEGFAYALYTTWSAWSRDGSIGYMWMIGVTNDSYDYGVFQPQVYYTLDKGDTWNEIELNLEDYWVLKQYLDPWEDENGVEGTVRPSFLNGDKDYPGAVDYYGRLNLFASVYGSTRGDVLNPEDSLWVRPDALGGYLFDFIIDTDGIFDIVPITEIKTKVSSNMYWEFGLDHRLQVAKTEYEYVILATWADDVISGSDSLVNPDVFTWSLCTEDRSAGPENMTDGTLYSGFYFFTSLAEITHISMSNWGVLMPLTTSVSPAEFFSNDSPSGSITNYFVSDAIAPLSSMCLESVKEESQIKSFVSISQNIPNPFTKNTKIIIESNTPIPKSISIEVSDILGHIIYSHDEGLIYNYKEIVLKDFKKGVYFYTICVDDICETKKMLVE